MKNLPRSRQGWVLLHPMFPMAISEYRQLVKLKFGVKLKSGGRVIVQMRRDLDHPGETARRTRMTLSACRILVRALEVVTMLSQSCLGVWVFDVMIST